MIHTSPAFTQFTNVGKQQEKNYASKRRNSVTEAHLLLGTKAAKTFRKQRFDIFCNKVEQAVDDRKAVKRLTLREREIVLSTVGRSADERQNHHPLASNPNAREIFFDAMFYQLQAIHQRDDIPMFFATIVDVNWCRPKEASSFDTKSMALRVKRALRDIGYHGLFILEVQVLTKMEGVYFMPHVHGFIWPSTASSLGPRLAAKRLNKRFAGIGKAKGVTIAVMPQSLPNSLTTRFHYATKLPDSSSGYCTAKVVDGSLVSSRGRILKNSPDNFSNKDALRIARILAQFQVDDTIFAIGEGTKVRKAASKILTAKLQDLKIATSGPSPKTVVKLVGKTFGK